MADKVRKGGGASAHTTDTSAGAEATSSKNALNRRDYLKSAALGVAGVGAVSLGMPSIAKAQNKTWKLKLQSNWTGIGIQSQDRAAQLYIRSEEHTSELQSLMRNSYAVFCLQKKNKH